MNVTISFNITEVITWIIVGAIAGWLAGVVLRGRHMGTLWNIIIGLIGAVIGGFLFKVFNIQLPAFLSQPRIELRLVDIVVAFIGAVVILLIASLIYRRRV